MKHMMFAGTLMLGALGFAQGQSTFTWTPPPCVPGVNGCATGTGAVDIEKRDQVYTGNLTAELLERITVSIPAVVAMHLHETSWTVDLNNMANCDCYRAGEHNKLTGVDDVVDIKAIMERAGSTWTGDNQAIAGNNYSFAGSVSLALNPGLEQQLTNRVTSYPGIVYQGANVLWKGPIVCWNRKIVEKFANSTKWKVNISLANASANFPKLVLGDRLPAARGGYKEVAVLNGGGALEFTNAEAGLAGKTTGGWLDDYILEALVFDGSEVAGNHTADVKFQLTGTF